MRLLSDRCTQNAAPSASFHAQYHPRLGHPLIQQTPQDPCTALGRIRAVLSRSRKHRGFSRASGDVCCHTWLQPLASDHPCCVSASAVVRARKLSLAQYLRSLISSPRHVGSYAGDRPRARSLAPRSCWQIVSRTPCSWQLDAPFSTLLQPHSGFPCPRRAGSQLTGHRFSAAPRFSALSRRSFRRCHHRRHRRRITLTPSS